MDGMKTNDPFEQHLRRNPPEAPPAGVYERLQARAAWNRPPTGRPVLPFVVTALLAAVLVIILLSWNVPRQAPSAPGTLAPAPASSSPVVPPAPLPPVAAMHVDPDQVGGLSSLLLGQDPPFSVPFDPPGSRPSFDDILMES